MLTPETRIYLDPPLTNVKEIQLIFIYTNIARYDKPFYLMCDIIEPKSSYSNIIPSGENIELKPSQLLSVIPSPNNNPVNYFNLLLLDENGKKVDMNNKPVRIYLKISC